ncbi:MAPEG family protein [Aurantimonas sp. HBX-1]|uniref:MAPEG family protein n=1 Tax=Aurantimonas sp. HBX-1 TaxID=2906072 RepID=UPI001F2F886D|nr:MAPEG family protein [Aurantimonas sp. HBX-1]UIJ72692.1 MAPEG family protein [Aurantimonas sp. HBX-1]
MTETMQAAIGAVAIYAGLAILILIWLGVQTGRVRQAEKVYMGDGGNPRMIRIMRGHANALEFIPPTLIAMLLLALAGAPVLLIHLLGVLLIAGRFIHALHFVAAKAPSWQRFAGTVLSFLALGGAGAGALIAGVLSLAW